MLIFFSEGLSKLQAVADQQKLFDELRQRFAKRLFDHLSSTFAKQVKRVTSFPYF